VQVVRTVLILFCTFASIALYLKMHVFIFIYLEEFVTAGFLFLFGFPQEIAPTQTH